MFLSDSTLTKYKKATMPELAQTFRSASPNLQDGKRFARYLDQAAEGFFGFMLGGRSEEIIAEAYQQPGHDLSYQHVTFVENNQKIVGMVSGYTAEQHQQSPDRPLRQAAGKYNLRFAIVSILCAPLMRILETIAAGDFYLQAIAIDQERRGKGLGSTLMDLAEDRAHSSGSQRLSLDVSADNVIARKLYERRGMTIESQWPRRFAIPKLKFYRMVKVI